MTNIYKDAKEFAITSIKPYTKDADDKGEFPELIFEKIKDAGYLNLLIPKEFGGKGLTLVEHEAVCRAFSEYSASVGLCYMMHNVGLVTVLDHGSDTLKKEICNEVVYNKKMLALAYSESGTGTNFMNTTEITVDFQEKFALFNGKKSMVTSGNYADYYVTLVPYKIVGETEQWLFPLHSNGLTFSTSTWNGLGMRSNVSCEMCINNLKLDYHYRIGAEGKGNEQAQSPVPFFINGLAAVYSGLSQAILDEAVTHTTNRKYPDGKSLSDIETVQLHLAEIFKNTKASVLLSRNAAESFAKEEEDAFLNIVSARAFSCDKVIENARLGMRVCGGKAYNRYGNMERFLRDSLAGQVMAPGLDFLNILTGQLISNK